ncbi:hypothetical protein CSKR_103223 [Clonorchis sinensis]|uniref:Uncharacterized protein n=1 Tax=Clonorchis sinensis TaxID=79923 RepID=A0A419PCY3_CLOSI|nr:hypothetical protein CSKR_103223 [Clonorchis sinensis]
MATREPEHELYRKLLNFVGSTETQRWLNSNPKLSRLAGETRWKEDDMGSQAFGPFKDHVVVAHRPGGVDNSQPSHPNRALPKFKAWEDEGARLRTTGDGRCTRATGGVAGIRTHHGATQQGNPPCRAYPFTTRVFHPSCMLPDLQGGTNIQAVINAVCALLHTPATNF